MWLKLWLVGWLVTIHCPVVKVNVSELLEGKAAATLGPEGGRVYKI
jgi:hypothetical protein